MIPLLKFLFGVAKAVICDNPDVGERIVEYGITPTKVFPISPFTKQYLEVASNSFDENTEDFLKSHTPVILTYLEVRPEYGLDSVFRAVGELARQRSGLGLIVIGAPRERETIAGYARTAGIADRCLHLGMVEHATFCPFCDTCRYTSAPPRPKGSARPSAKRCMLDCQLSRMMQTASLRA